MRQNAILSCLLLIFYNGCCDQDNWVEPHAWAELSTDQLQLNYDWEDSCPCQSQVPAKKSLATIEDQLALIYFKKFVNTLFERSKLKYSNKLKQYKRSLEFTLRQSEIDEIATMQDVRDLDIMLTSILEKAEDVPLTASYDNYSYINKETGVFALLTDIFKDFVQLLNTSEVKFMVTVLVIIVAGWIVSKRVRYSALAIVLIGVLLYGYFVTYLECNRKLELEPIIELLDNNSWYSKMWNYFSSTEAKRKQTILKSSKLNLPYCRPDHVFIMYMSDIFLKQIEMIIESTTQSINSLSAKLPFPMNYIAPFALVCMVCYILTLVFKNVINPKAWIGLVHGKSSAPVENTQQAALSNDATADRLSGENLKIVLNVIGKRQGQQILRPVSGVQELLEPLEAPPQRFNESNLLSNEHPNVSNSSADIAKEAGFTVVDDNDEQIQNC